MKLSRTKLRTLREVGGADPLWTWQEPTKARVAWIRGAVRRQMPRGVWVEIRTMRSSNPWLPHAIGWYWHDTIRQRRLKPKWDRKPIKADIEREWRIYQRFKV